MEPGILMSVMTSWMPRTLLKNSDGLVGVEGSDHCVAAAFQNGRLGRGEKPKVSRMPMPSPASKRSMLARCPAQDRKYSLIRYSSSTVRIIMRLEQVEHAFVPPRQTYSDDSQDNW